MSPVGDAETAMSPGGDQLMIVSRQTHRLHYPGRSQDPVSRDSMGSAPARCEKCTHLNDLAEVAFQACFYRAQLI